MVGIVFSHPGTLDKFVGDAVMAVWGTVTSGGVTEDCRRAVPAALDMLAAAEEMRRGWARESRAELRLGIGINQGPAVSGNIGSEEKMEPPVIGDLVNPASRLEGLTKQYGVPLVLSESVALRVRGAFPLRTLDTVRAGFAGVLEDGDLAAAEMLRRCRGFEAQPPGPDWEPVVTLEGK